MRKEAFFLIVFLVLCGCKGAGIAAEAEVAKEAQKKVETEKLSQSTDLQKFVLSYRDNSYIYWQINREGLPSEEASRRAERSRYPTQEVLIKALENEFNRFFPKGTSVDKFVHYMKNHGAARCVAQDKKLNIKTNKWEPKYNVNGKLAGLYVCPIETTIPLPHSQKNLNPALAERDDETVV